MIVDPVGPLAEQMLACLVGTLDAAEVPVCRAVWHPGAEVPWDACGQTVGGVEGQAWVAVRRVWPTDRFPAEPSGPQERELTGMAVELRVGVLRCAATVDASGHPPSPADVSADADKASRDRALTAHAIVCCALNDDASWMLGGWEPMGPQGGCVGGAWTVTVWVPACICVEDD